jgi:hypothetical protein
MSKLTKGQRNEIARHVFQARIDKIKESGFTIKDRCMGPKNYADSWTYYLYYKDVEVFYGAFDWKETLVKQAEQLIETGCFSYTPTDDFLSIWKWTESQTDLN